MTSQRSERPDDQRVEPLYAAVKPRQAGFQGGPGLALRLVFVALVALALLALVLKQAF